MHMYGVAHSHFFYISEEDHSNFVQKLQNFHFWSSIFKYVHVFWNYLGCFKGKHVYLTYMVFKMHMQDIMLSSENLNKAYLHLKFLPRISLNVCKSATQTLL